MVAETKWYSLSPSQVEKKLNTNITKGLALSEIKKRQQLYGLNKLREKKTLTIYHRFINQFRDFLVIILIIASIISFAIGEITDCIVISCIIILNALLGVLQEHRASKALEALQQLATPKASVIRNSAIQKIPSKELVPGDIVILETGNYVPADLRLVESSNLKIDESSITGESIPITKDTSNIYNEDISFAEQRNCVFMGTIITHGKAKGIVIATGINTQMGLISQMLESVGEDETPLQRKLSEFGQKLGIACLITVAIIFALGILRGIPHIDMFMVSVSLAVAAIPEGLPAIVTIVLALGMQRMAKRNTIVKKLHAVETLGSTTVICSDKTGTLTQNEMTVTTIYSDRITYNIKGQGYMPYGDLWVLSQFF
ncbi:MAG TPA: HAD-IC family P-type ATPase, partial [Thermoanaerobacterales bacterium]|nr:HAD-IC family P-type ATPase [Thermoanaerobacterales bacterium]